MDHFANHRYDLCLALGKTFSEPLRFTDGTEVFRTIEAVTAAAPAALTIPGHGLPNGWPFLIQNAKGMPALNRPEAWTSQLVDANSTTIPALNTKDYDPYEENSGVIFYNQPADLSNRTGLLRARANRASDQVLFSLTSEDSQILIEPDEDRVTIQLSPIETTALIPILKDFDSVAYDMELPGPGGAVDLWTWGDIQILRDM